MPMYYEMVLFDLKIIYFTLPMYNIPNVILINIIPKKNMDNPNFLFEFTLLTLKSIYPTNKLNNAHKIFVKGDESPWIGGSANGVGKGFPESPLT